MSARIIAAVMVLSIAALVSSWDSAPREAQTVTMSQGAG